MSNQMRLWSILLISLFTSSLVLPTVCQANGGVTLENLPFDHIFQFGDSISDAGNLVRENPLFSSIYGRLPYGITLGQPTGRCSDGLLIIDYFAKFFDVPLLSPYHDKQGRFVHGVNFAVAGATALNTSVLAAKDIISPVTKSSLFVQLDWFKSYLNSTCSYFPECKQIVSKSLIVMGGIGGNDYNYAILEGKTPDQLNKLVPEVVEAIREATKEVINLGATKVVVPGNFPMGCLPMYLALFETKNSSRYDELGCLKDLNDFSKSHNDHLQVAIKELKEEYPDVAIVYGDYFSALRWILQHASFLGFDEDASHTTCCGIGNNKYNFDLTRMCQDNVPVCANPDERISWDGIHHTQHAYFHMARRLLQEIIPGILQVV